MELQEQALRKSIEAFTKYYNNPELMEGKNSLLFDSWVIDNHKEG